VHLGVWVQILLKEFGLAWNLEGDNLAETVVVDPAEENMYRPWVFQG
jgi:hypothetical protein